MSEFEGKAAIVTGAGRGIGRETALLLARLGAKVVVNDLGGGPQGGGGDQSVAQTVVDEIKQAGGDAVAETSSIAEMSGGKSVVECCMDNFSRVDFLINNAGIIRPKRIWEMDENDFELVLAVNLKACFYTVRHAVEHMKRQGGAIVNLSSPSALGHLGMSNYGAAKEGVVGFTRCIARDLGEFGIRCNAVRPISGGSAMEIPEVYETIEYSMEKLGIPPISNQWLGNGGVPGVPKHVASMLVWLCSSSAQAINGREVYIHGGMVGLMQEPEVIRAQANPEGWSFEALSDPQTAMALTYGEQNRFTG